MLTLLLHPTALRRALRPQQGALENAADAVRLQAVEAAEREEAVRTQARALATTDWHALQPREVGHGVQFADDTELGVRLAAFVTEGLQEGEVCVVVATPLHLAGLRHRLALAGMTEAARELLVELDAATLLPRLLRDGRPDPDLFALSVAPLVRGTLQSGRRLRAFGEMVALLYDSGDRAGAVELEELWDGLQRELGFPLLCAYPAAAGEEDLLREQLCRTHSHLVGG